MLKGGGIVYNSSGRNNFLFYIHEWDLSTNVIAQLSTTSKHEINKQEKSSPHKSSSGISFFSRF